MKITYFMSIWRRCSIALNKQIHLYSVDTAAFYTDEEHEIDIKLSKARFDKIKLPEEQLLLDKLYNQNKAIYTLWLSNVYGLELYQNYLQNGTSK